MGCIGPDSRWDGDTVMGKVDENVDVVPVLDIINGAVVVPLGR